MAVGLTCPDLTGILPVLDRKTEQHLGDASKGCRELPLQSPALLTSGTHTRTLPAAWLLVIPHLAPFSLLLLTLGPSAGPSAPPPVQLRRLTHRHPSLGHCLTLLGLPAGTLSQACSPFKLAAQNPVRASHPTELKPRSFSWSETMLHDPSLGHLPVLSVPLHQGLCACCFLQHFTGLGTHLLRVSGATSLLCALFSSKPVSRTLLPPSPPTRCSVYLC